MFSKTNPPRITDSENTQFLFLAAVGCGALLMLVQFISGIVSISQYSSFFRYFNFFSIANLFMSSLVRPLLIFGSFAALTFLFAKKNLTYLLVPLALNLIFGFSSIFNAFFAIFGFASISSIPLTFFNFFASVAFAATFYLTLIGKLGTVKIASLGEVRIFTIICAALAALIILGSFGNLRYSFGSFIVAFLSSLFYIGYGIISFLIDPTTIPSGESAPAAASFPGSASENVYNNHAAESSAHQPPRTTSNHNLAPELLEDKSIALCIVLTFVTSGIYGIFWIYSIMRKIKLLNNEEPDVVGELLLYIFVPFYSLYWIFSRSQKLHIGADKNGMRIPDNSVMYLVIALFGLMVVSLALIQDSLNNIARYLASPNQSNTPSSGYNTAPQYAAAAPSHSGEDAIAQLEKLNTLKQQGILSEEEFEAKKKDLLTRI